MISWRLSGMKRWLCLVEMLLEMAESKNMTSITKTAHIGYNEKESKRLCNVFDWITTNFEKDLKLSEAAEIAK